MARTLFFAGDFPERARRLPGTNRLESAPKMSADIFAVSADIRHDVHERLPHKASAMATIGKVLD
jgi:hypothetical protein